MLLLKNTISRLKTDRFGNRMSESQNRVTNLSSHKLTADESFVLSHGLNFSLPPSKIKKEFVLAEFEVLAAQLKHHKPISTHLVSRCKSRLNELAYGYSTSQVDRSDFLMNLSCFNVVKSLRNNKNIVICKQDKGNGIVVLDFKDYVDKMHNILDEKSKFELVGSFDKYDNTQTIETRIRNKLLKLVDRKDKDGKVVLKEISEEDQNFMRPVGSQIPRIYGLPKTHKSGCPVRPILSMVKSPQHRVAQWLSQLLQPVLEKYSKFCLSDSFTFAKYMRERPFNKTDFLCSFDIKSLFTCVPVQQVIDICADALFRDGLNRSRLTESSFRKLICMSTTSVEFLFNNDVYKQKDGVAMGSPLGPILANIFVGFYEEKLFASFPKPPTYFRYVDDTFVIFDNSSQHELFLHQLNSMHPSLQFTTETEENNCLPFLDVFIEKDTSAQKYLTSVYRKPTFTGDYVRFEAFCHKNRKMSLIRTLVNRAKQICSPERLQSELSKLKLIFSNNGYPAYLVDKVISSELEKIPSNVNPPDENKTRVYNIHAITFHW